MSELLAVVRAEVERLRKKVAQEKALYRETLDRAVSAEKENERLRESLLESRNAAAAAMRVIATAPDSDTLVEAFVAELAASRVADGFGVRADSLLTNKEAR